MDYRLIVLTHGDCEPLDQTLHSFAENVIPHPTSAFLVYDGPHAFAASRLIGRKYPPELPFDGAIRSVGKQSGFCEATGHAWRLAVTEEPRPEYVFWLEHDFIFNRRVDLEALRWLLDYDARIAQVSLMRGAGNRVEEAAGGLVESRPDDFTLCTIGTTGEDYLEHRAYFTTNPSLMCRRFMAENPWMSYVDQCEGKFGLDLVQRGYQFAVWGNGEPWVTHIGERTGFGY